MQCSRTLLRRSKGGKGIFEKIDEWQPFGIGLIVAPHTPGTKSSCTGVLPVGIGVRRAFCCSHST
jgi:hypothetical protein